MILDSLPPMARHLVLMLAAALLGWGGTEVVPWLQSRGDVSAGIAALLIAAIAYLTPLTRQYGVGSKRGDLTAREVLR